MSPTRRDFLKAGLGAPTLVSLAAGVPDFLTGSANAAARPDDRGTVLVVVQLSGGNDGLNTVVPYGDDEYARNRSTLRLPTRELHKIDSLLGFHPRMEAIARLYKEGRLSIVQGVGYPNQKRDHQGAMRVWHTADPDRSERQTGWLGRVADRAWNPDEGGVPAAFVGSIARPFALNAEKAVVPTIRSIEELAVRPTPGDGMVRPQDRRVANASRSPADNPLLAFLRQSIRQSNAGSRRVEAVIRASGAGSGAGPFQLARDFHTVVQLIRADLGIRIFFTELGGGGIGGFDNHANQLGNHGALLHHLSESVAALVRDLERDKLLDRVLLMTFSEFGRTVKENGRRGTGHGAAAPVLLAGGRLKGGLVGRHPSLTDLDNGGLKFHTDFRRLYATVLDQWLGLESEAVLGRRFAPVDVLAENRRTAST